MHRTGLALTPRRGLAPLALLLALASGPAPGQTPPGPERPPPVRVDSETAGPPGPRGQRPLAVPDSPEAAAPRIVTTQTDRVAGMVNRLYNAGRAAGLSQVLYDNRDANHSRPRLDAFPQLRETRYGPPFTETGQDRGLAGPVLFDMPVIGNASLAVTRGLFARSLPRLALQNQATAEIAHALFAANHLYVYPEHRDHDSARGGDRFAAQTPYMVISQGSSGSDRPFLRALFLTYAAFQPETFAALRENGLLPATAQMILRRTQRGVTSDAVYLSPRAHPTAFDAEDLRPTAMVGLASALRPEEIPPMVQLEVTRDFTAQPGRDYLARNLSETIFTTPGAIARAWRSFAGQRRMAISAEGTTDPNGHPLRFSWVLLRGDPTRVTITPQGPNGAEAEIVIDWHPPGTITGPDGIASGRVEIGVFADNGFHQSAPAFVSVALPQHQARDYAGSGATARLWQLNYADPEAYVDPLIWPTAPWDDRLAHGPDGHVEIMTRRRQGQPAPYTLTRDPAGGWIRRDQTGEARIVHRAAGPPAERAQLFEEPLP